MDVSICAPACTFSNNDSLSDLFENVSFVSQFLNEVSDPSVIKGWVLQSCHCLTNILNMKRAMSERRCVHLVKLNMGVSPNNIEPIESKQHLQTVNKIIFKSDVALINWCTFVACFDLISMASCTTFGGNPTCWANLKAELEELGHLPSLML